MVYIGYRDAITRAQQEVTRRAQTPAGAERLSDEEIARILQDAGVVGRGNNVPRSLIDQYRREAGDALVQDKSALKQPGEVGYEKQQQAFYEATPRTLTPQEELQRRVTETQAKQLSGIAQQTGREVYSSFATKLNQRAATEERPRSATQATIRRQQASEARAFFSGQNPEKKMSTEYHEPYAGASYSFKQPEKIKFPRLSELKAALPFKQTPEQTIWRLRRGGKYGQALVTGVTIAGMTAGSTVGRNVAAMFKPSTYVAMGKAALTPFKTGRALITSGRELGLSARRGDPAAIGRIAGEVATFRVFGAATKGTKRVIVATAQRINAPRLKGAGTIKLVEGEGLATRISFTGAVQSGRSWWKKTGRVVGEGKVADKILFSRFRFDFGKRIKYEVAAKTSPKTRGVTLAESSLGKRAIFAEKSTKITRGRLGTSLISTTGIGGKSRLLPFNVRAGVLKGDFSMADSAITRRTALVEGKTEFTFTREPITRSQFSLLERGTSAGWVKKAYPRMKGSSRFQQQGSITGRQRLLASKKASWQPGRGAILRPSTQQAKRFRGSGRIEQQFAAQFLAAERLAGRGRSAQGGSGIGTASAFLPRGRGAPEFMPRPRSAQHRGRDWNSGVFYVAGTSTDFDTSFKGAQRQGLVGDTMRGHDQWSGARRSWEHQPDFRFKHIPDVGVTPTQRQFTGATPKQSPLTAAITRQSSFPPPARPPLPFDTPPKPFRFYFPDDNRRRNVFKLPSFKAPKRGYSYTATIRAGQFNIRGMMPKRITGIGLRPLLTSTRRKRHKRRK